MRSHEIEIEEALLSLHTFADAFVWDVAFAFRSVSPRAEHVWSRLLYLTGRYEFRWQSAS